MSGYAYYNGAFGSRESISIPLCDRSVFFGDSVYDAMIGMNGRIYQLQEHVERLIGNCATLGFPNVPTHGTISDLLSEVVGRSGFDSYFVYVQISRQRPERAHPAAGITDCAILITVDDFTLPSPSKRLKLILCEDKRYEYCNIKTTNLLPNVIYATEARDRGCDEAILHRGDTVTECAHSNVHIIKNGALITHPNGPHILPGITRATLIDLCELRGIPVVQRPFTLDELFSADEVLITSTSKLCIPAESIDGITVGGRNENTVRMLSEAMREQFLTRTAR